MNSPFQKICLQTFVALSVVMTFAGSTSTVIAADTLVLNPPDAGATAKHVVLIAGDEEYRSEESLPMLAKILSQKHGFRCTVLFSFGPDGADYIDSNNHQVGSFQSIETPQPLLII